MKLRKTAAKISLILAFSLLLSGTALAAAMGDELDSATVPVRGGIEYTGGVYWSGDDFRREYYLEYTPNDEAFPVVVYGSKLLNYGDFVSMAKLLNERGYYVIGGINGDYYNTWDYQPLGIVISDGELITTDGGFQAVGFHEDGSAIIGKPAVEMKASFSGETYRLEGLNKARGSGYMLYSSEYSAATRNSDPGWDIVLSAPEDEIITTDCEIEFTVEEIIESEGSCEIPDGKYILSLPESADEWRTGGVERLSEGDTVTLTVTCAEGWEDVDWAVGTLYRLIEDGEICSDDFELGAASRTAVGLKEDGTVVLYTIDGRQPGLSIGATMQQVAERMQELGCVDAILMDGGGSTTLNLVRPGESAISQINSPSDGKQRSVTNYIMLVSTEPPDPDGDPERLVIYPYSARLLTGAQIEPDIMAVDSVGFAVRPPDDLEFDGDGLGSVEDGVFTADESGEGVLTVSSDGVESGQMELLVVDTPDSIAVSEEESGRERTELTLETGESIDFTASAVYGHLPLTVRDECFTWEVEGDIGEIDETGLFTAGESTGEGKITVTAGELTVELAVEVKFPAGEYADVAEDSWYYEAVKAMGEGGYMTGVTETEFAPDAYMTRAMFVTLLHRLEGSPAPEGESTFADVAADSWYSDAVAWASENGLVTGYDAATFAPGDSISREQMAALLCRYAAWKGEDVSTEQSLEAFADRDAISDYAVSSVQWAVGRGLINGMSETEFAPQATASRAQVAVLLDRFLSE